MIYLFSYELGAGLFRNMDNLIAELRGFPAWCQCLDRTWLIATHDDINIVSDRIGRHFRDTDYWLIVRITREYQGWLPNEIWEWLQDSIGRIGT